MQICRVSVENQFVPWKLGKDIESPRRTIFSTEALCRSVDFCGSSVHIS